LPGYMCGLVLFFCLPGFMCGLVLLFARLYCEGWYYYSVFTRLYVKAGIIVCQVICEGWYYYCLPGYM
jgi:hypothetical protein